MKITDRKTDQKTVKTLKIRTATRAEAQIQVDQQSKADGHIEDKKTDEDKYWTTESNQNKSKALDLWNWGQQEITRAGGKPKESAKLCMEQGSGRLHYRQSHLPQHLPSKAIPILTTSA